MKPNSEFQFLRSESDSSKPDPDPRSDLQIPMQQTHLQTKIA